MDSNRPTKQEPLTELEPVPLRYLDCATTNWAEPVGIEGEEF